MYKKIAFIVVLLLVAAGITIALVHKAAPENKALIVRELIARHQWNEATKAINDVIHESKIEDWDYNPFDSFFKSLIPAYDPSYGAHLDEWISADKDSYLAYLLRAQYHYNLAKHFRGGSFIKDVSEDNLNKFQVYIKLAAQDTLWSVKLNGKFPYTYLLLMHIDQDIGNEQSHQKIFNVGTTLFPDFYLLYATRVFELAPKWGGSLMRQIDFVNEHAGKAAPNSVLKTLYLDLYLSLIADAQLDCTTYEGEQKTNCEKSMEGLISGPEMTSHLKEFFALYNTTDHYVFDRMLLSRLAPNCCGPAGPYFKSLLGVAEEALGVDNFAINYSYAAYYDQVDDYKKSLEYLDKALSEADDFHFPDKTHKNITIALILHKMGAIHTEMKEYKIAVDKLNAALALDDSQDEYYMRRCEAYSFMSKTDEVIKDCTRAIEIRDRHVYVHKLRAKAYTRLRKYAEAESDYQAILQSPEEYAARIHNATINDLIALYGMQKKYQEQIDLYNANSQLFSEGDKGFAAINYLRRCAVYEQMGQYQNAYNDCDASVKLNNNILAQKLKEQAMHKLQASGGK